MHAVEFLKQSSPTIPPVTVVFGAQRHLKSSALALLRKLVIDDDETSLTRFNGQTADLQSVTDELRTASMWGDRRLVIIEEADDFVTKYRPQLEKVLEKPAKKSVLVLDAKSWPKTTRLAKQVAKEGLEIDCSELKGAALSKWLLDTAKETYQTTLSRDAGALLIELVGDDLGMLDSELSKLASYVGGKGRIDIADVQALVGGWRMETTWAMTDAVRDGDTGFALNALDQLLGAGEAAPKLLGGISYVFKKFAVATDLSRSMPLDQALRQAGVFPQAVGASTAYLRRIGRPKAERIVQYLVETEAGLKGSSRLPERVQLERLLLTLAGKS